MLEIDFLPQNFLIDFIASCCWD